MSLSVDYDHLGLDRSEVEEQIHVLVVHADAARRALGAYGIGLGRAVNTQPQGADFRAMLEQLRPFVSEIVQNRGSVVFGGDFYTTGIIEERWYEQALILPTSKGLTVITGCAHPGIVEIVEHAKELMKQDVYFVMGGFHLLHTDSTQVTTIAQKLRRLTKYVGPCHCTGGKAQAIFKAVFAEDYIDVHAGLKLRLDAEN